MWSDNPSKIDFLNTSFITKTVQKIIDDPKLLPISIGIYGPWGSGKSTILGFLEYELQKDKKTFVINCNLWTLQNYEDPTTALINCIMSKLESVNSSKVDDLRVLARDLSKNRLFDLFLGSIIPANIKDFIISSIEQLSKKEITKTLSEFQKKLLEFLDENRIDKIIVLIDDLDRCTYNTIITTLESIKLFLFLPKMAFVMAMDQDVIQVALKEYFKNIEPIKISDYFEKLIQVPIYIPAMSKTLVENYITSLLLDKAGVSLYPIIEEYNSKIIAQKNQNYSILKTHSEHTEIKKISQQVQELANLFIPLKYTTPRMCKRVLNNVALKKFYAETLSLDIKDNILTKLTLFELADTEGFKSYISYVSSVMKPTINEFYKGDKDLSVSKDWLGLKPDIFNESNIGDYLFIMQYFIEKKQIFSNNDTHDLFQKIFEIDLDRALLKHNLLNNSNMKYEEIWKYTVEELVNEEPSQIIKVLRNVLKIASIIKFKNEMAKEIWDFIAERQKILLTKDTIDLVRLINIVFKEYPFYLEYKNWGILDNRVKKQLDKE